MPLKKPKEVALEYWRERYYRCHLQITKCKCPRCEIIHARKLFWTGRGMPRKMCSKCRNIRDNEQDQRDSIEYHPYPSKLKRRS